MPRRRYSDEERATALAALAANGGNVERTAEQVGIPRKTLTNWSRGTNHPEAAELGHKKRPPMAEALEAVAWKLLDAIPGKVQKAPLNQTATAMGIALDKARLLRGEPTEITSGEVRVDVFTRVRQYADLFASLESPPAGAAGGNGVGQPLRPPAGDDHPPTNGVPRQ